MVDTSGVFLGGFAQGQEASKTLQQRDRTLQSAERTQSFNEEQALLKKVNDFRAEQLKIADDIIAQKSQVPPEMVPMLENNLRRALEMAGQISVKSGISTPTQTQTFLENKLAQFQATPDRDWETFRAALVISAL